MVPQQVKKTAPFIYCFLVKHRRNSCCSGGVAQHSPPPCQPSHPPLPPLAPASCCACETLCWAKNHRETFPVNVSHMPLSMSMFGKTLPVSAPHVSLFVTSCLCPSLRCEWVEPVAVSQQLGEKLSQESRFLSPAASSEGKPIRGCLTVTWCYLASPVCWSPGKLVARAEGGVFRCRWRSLSLPHSVTPDR